PAGRIERRAVGRARVVGRPGAFRLLALSLPDGGGRPYGRWRVWQLGDSAPLVYVRPAAARPGVSPLWSPKPVAAGMGPARRPQRDDRSWRPRSIGNRHHARGTDGLWLPSAMELARSAHRRRSALDAAGGAELPGAHGERRAGAVWRQPAQLLRPGPLAR